MATPAPADGDLRMRQRLVRGEEAALRELYDRFAPLVHSLATRITDDTGAAEQVTLEVFARVWQDPAAHDPRDGTLRSWIAGLARQEAVRRLRESGSAGPGNAGPGSAGDPGGVEAGVREASAAARADYILTSMPAPLRRALDLACRRKYDYRQVAAELGVTEEEARRRLRLGLQLLSTAGAPPERPS
ncbi:sigma-70 family RNA polymerase sigma factor [Streptomyces sp. SCUT-3]|uniref:sigma-70 family RNA polymerase sigma factor n=1 Tax=Streptomyces TaxID=1883 RepID=UPI0015FAB877|nr:MULTISPECIES: sigma-70 family RNA polymerase sigma factor [unclassified Streptomyces]MCZ2527805.1 sigma-70 family RNA polymerase sigma factor [Streptomyces sp. HB2AG]QMV22965.1 sigma-70 family RNA polymerase sigma factor [Streptomyces sp. SCUT-3]